MSERTTAAGWRRPAGGAIDRGRPIEFRFNGRRYAGLHGDTLASALLANGVRLVARSFKYHRPRGIVGVGLEEPNAVVQVLAPRRQPMTLATTLPLEPGLEAVSVNCWPGPNFDVRAIHEWFRRWLPAGFYYKTFMGPEGAWPFYERWIRRAAGLGVVHPSSTGTGAGTRTLRRFAHCDILVIGAGVAGLAAARIAGRAGLRVLLVDDQARAGASLAWADRKHPVAQWIDTAEQELDAMARLQRLARTQVAGYYDHNFLAAVERRQDGAQVFWKVRARQVIIATGAIERPLLFPDNDRPGAMLCSAAVVYLRRYAVACGKEAVVACNNDSGHEAAHALAHAGVRIAAIVELRESVEPWLRQRAQQLDIPLLLGHGITAVVGRRAVRAVRVAPLASPLHARELRCDLLAMSGGWDPQVHLHSQSGGAVVYDDAKACFVPGAAAQASHCAGSANGRFDPLDCIEDGRDAATAAVRALGRDAVASDARVLGLPELERRSNAAILPSWRVSIPVEKRAFVDFANDVTTADLALARREGYESVELAKRYTTAGMGIDQGKTSNVHAIGVLAELRAEAPGAIGTTTFRPPYAPVEFGAIAGFEPGALIRPARTTPMTAWHEAQGAVMYESGAHWRRPGYYPRAGESMADAVRRECLAVRQRAGLYDSTPLGKFEVRGPGAAAFLDWVCAGAVVNLRPGRGRYSLLLREDGRLFDDGVVFRIGASHFWLSTTSGNTDAVWGWLEFLRQRHWKGERVFLVQVTAQWANAVVCGPRAREVLQRAVTDIDLDAKAFAFMSLREATVAGLHARIFRVSFTGESSYEINVPARHGLELWQALLAAGSEAGIEPIGSEANHVLRIEKGYLSIGHEADGMATPEDLGLGWAVSRSKADFIGQRSLLMRSAAMGDNARPRELVGLLASDPRRVLAEGAQILSPRGDSSAGHVTASVMSPSLGRSIALALLDDGQQRHGEEVRVSVEDGRGLASTSATVVKPAFYDIEGTRLHA